MACFSAYLHCIFLFCHFSVNGSFPLWPFLSPYRVGGDDEAISAEGFDKWCLMRQRSTVQGGGQSELGRRRDVVYSVCITAILRGGGGRGGWGGCQRGTVNKQINKEEIMYW